MRLLVEGAEAVLTTCERHADWLRGYVEEDAGVRLVDTVSENSSQGTIGPEPA